MTRWITLQMPLHLFEYLSSSNILSLIKLFSSKNSSWTPSLLMAIVFGIQRHLFLAWSWVGIPMVICFLPSDPWMQSQYSSIRIEVETSSRAVWKDGMPHGRAKYSQRGSVGSGRHSSVIWRFLILIFNPWFLMSISNQCVFKEQIVLAVQYCRIKLCFRKEEQFLYLSMFITFVLILCCRPLIESKGISSGAPGLTTLCPRSQKIQW